MSFIIGGNEHVVVGWGEYEVEKRKVRWGGNNERYNRYYKKKLVYPEDIIESVLNSRKISEVYTSIDQLTNLLKQYEAKYYSTFGEPYRLPMLTSDRLSDFLQNDFTNYDKILHINNHVKKFVDMLGLEVEIEEIPKIQILQQKKPVLVMDDNEVMNMENAMLPDISNVERGQGLLAMNCDRINQKLKSMIKTELKSELEHELKQSLDHEITQEINKHRQEHDKYMQNHSTLHQQLQTQMNAQDKKIQHHEYQIQNQNNQFIRLESIEKEQDKQLQQHEEQIRLTNQHELEQDSQIEELYTKIRNRANRANSITITEDELNKIRDLEIYKFKQEESKQHINRPDTTKPDNTKPDTPRNVKINESFSVLHPNHDNPRIKQFTDEQLKDIASLTSKIGSNETEHINQTVTENVYIKNVIPSNTDNQIHPFTVSIPNIIQTTDKTRPIFLADLNNNDIHLLNIELQRWHKLFPDLNNVNTLDAWLSLVNYNIPVTNGSAPTLYNHWEQLKKTNKDKDHAKEWVPIIICDNDKSNTWTCKYFPRPSEPQELDKQAVNNILNNTKHGSKEKKKKRSKKRNKNSDEIYCDDSDERHDTGEERDDDEERDNGDERHVVKQDDDEEKDNDGERHVVKQDDDEEKDNGDERHVVKQDDDEEKDNNGDERHVVKQDDDEEKDNDGDERHVVKQDDDEEKDNYGDDISDDVEAEGSNEDNIMVYAISV